MLVLSVRVLPCCISHWGAYRRTNSWAENGLGWTQSRNRAYLPKAKDCIGKWGSGHIPFLKGLLLYYSLILSTVFLLLTELTYPAGQGFHYIRSACVFLMHLRPILTVCAAMRPGDKPPMAHVTARSVAFLDSFSAGGCSSRGEEDRDRPQAPNVQEHMYFPAPSASPGNIPHRGWKGDNDWKPAPCDCQATAGPHNGTFQLGAELDQLLHLHPFDGSCQLHGPSTAPSVSLSTRNGEDEKEHRPRVPAFLCPASERSFLPISFHLIVTQG